MKGITNIEFIVSVFVFLSTITFITTFIIGKVPALHHDAMIDTAKLNSYTLSQILILDKGFPDSWDSTNVKTIGLAIQPYNLSSAKILEIKELCTNITRMRELVGDVVINITYIDGGQVADCKTSILPVMLFYTRFALLDGKAVRVQVASA
ncbi:MAG: hypothetical protein V1802_01975 [Candidatus Aenigmatarchaeota archaeon]